ncbi:MAG TPA: flagellum-specific ATP synthase FliI, partial [Syntrophales bacterium]|nr:flagellum-specific ATP synthase FliI [Syntrophales bacterium]
LDGHISLTRELANRGHYPAVDVLQSISRVMIDVVDEEQRHMANNIQNILATYRKAEDLINIGAYVKGSNPDIDYAVSMIDRVNDFLRQNIHDKVDMAKTKKQMYNLFKGS